jgi:hypothetical protein
MTAAREPLPNSASPPYVLVVSLAPLDPTCTLFFTHLAGRVPLRIVQYPVDDIAGPLSGASAVIIVRGLFEFGGLIPCARALGVPLYYFLDDNFMLIRDEVGTYGTLYEEYSNDRVRWVLRRFSGVLLATKSLRTYFAEQRLHNEPLLYPPIAGLVLERPPPDSERPLTIAFFGGLHRRGPFVDHVFPAIRRLAMTTPVRLVAAGLEAGRLPAAAGVELICPTYDPSYAVALGIVARYGVDILVHPSSATANNIYKNPHVLINARVLGAAPIFSDVPPYDAVAGMGIAVLCDNTEEAWFDALARVAGDPAVREQLLSGLDAYCRRHFSGESNAAIIRTMLQRHPVPDAPTRVVRRVAGAGCLAVGHITARVLDKIARLRA